MVTIEQKLTLFSKLLNQDIKEEVERKSLQLDQEYEEIVEQFKRNVDRDAKALLESAQKRGETKKAELISKSKLQGKRALMESEGRLVEQFLDALKNKINNFINTPMYRTYLTKLIDTLDELENSLNPITIYLTKEDITNHGEFIKSQFQKYAIAAEQIRLEEASFEMLGGFMIIDEVLNTRIDCSISSVIEEHRAYIIERITECLRGAGDQVE